MTRTAAAVKVAIASDFLDAFARIPKAQQARVLDFISKFRRDPTRPSIHYETIRDARDPNLRSVRIDQAYRGIVLKPKAANVYLLLWVDHHDEAYQWARNKVCQVHPETGSIQVYEVEPGEAPGVGGAPDGDEAKGLFAAFRDRELRRLGVPDDLVPLARSIVTEEDLDRHAARFPEEAAEALYMLAAGYSVDEVLREQEKAAAPEQVDVEDFARALDNPDTQRRFHVVGDDLELASILNAPLEKWRVFLHPSQRGLVERDWNGPVRVLGGAGTGKTVAAMHRARWLAEHRITGEGERVLFTTFTRNLAADIQENLRKICSDEVLRRIEVVNLDRWVADFLRRQGYAYEIDYGSRTQPLWEKALTLAPDDPRLPEAFYRDEWEQVIQPQGVGSVEEYLRASRAGRGVRLNRRARMAVWPMFEEYRVLLDEYRLREPDDAMRDARLLLAQKGPILPYRAIVVDEAQDMGTQAFRLLRQMVPEGRNDLFIVGDAHQRIYRHRVVLGQCGIRIVGRSRKLRLNYRTTEETRRWAVGLLHGVTYDDLDGGVDDQRGYRSLLRGAPPIMRAFESFHAEVDFIAEYLQGLKEDGQALRNACLVARTNNLVDQYGAALRERGIPTYRVRRSEAEDRTQPGVRLATMHRVKGLEFDRVVIAGVNEGTVPFSPASDAGVDPLTRTDHLTRERSLLYVAATRAKKEVVVSSHGTPSPFLRKVRS